ncbi:GNAT family N-acetyltransferase [Ornithinibacillus sp. L9]|uniref:GNAT family N-acetyltransferase n=1 Tax=Ornithinibacillus caprae TaxID=2678566 RepID=A0A6N8FLY0_9BACI|nr:GNAT family N-acetyltransferase [Ornithinibacillus caprae]MUK88769.1 GNAT family N-acetyltransferase [Ornithinibacillus caprae]
MFTIRKGNFEDAEQIADVHVSSWKSTYQELLDEKDLSNITYENRKTLWETILKIQKQDQCVYIIKQNEDDKIIGFISGGPERTKNFNYDGEIYSIYLLDEYQKKGLGARLLKVFAERMKVLGYRSILVWVLTQNPSSRFYERYQAKPIGTEKVTIGQGTYQETAYGWGNIDDLLKLID